MKSKLNKLTSFARKSCLLVATVLLLFAILILVKTFRFSFDRISTTAEVIRVVNQDSEETQKLMLQWTNNSGSHTVWCEVPPGYKKIGAVGESLEITYEKGDPESAVLASDTISNTLLHILAIFTIIFSVSLAWLGNSLRRPDS